MNRVKYVRGIVWYPFLVEKEGRPKDLTLFSQKIKNLRQVYVRSCFNGFKYFASFRSPIDLYQYISSTPISEKCFDEIVSDSYQKVRFDIDINLEDCIDQFETMDQILQNVIDNLIASLLNILPDLNPSKMMYFSSHNEKKRSVHLVFPEYHTSGCDESKELFRIISKYIPDKYLRYIDHGIYGDNKSLRIMGCTKYGENRFKILNEEFILSGQKIKYQGPKPDTNSVRFISSLISVITDSICLPTVLKPKLKFKSEILPGGVVSLCIERAKKVLGQNYTFEYERTEGSIIVLNRTAPSFCELCRRIHDSQHPYLLLYENQIYFNCRRCIDKKKGLYLGNIEDAEFDFFRKEESIDEGVRYFQTEDGSEVIKSKGSIFVFPKKFNPQLNIENEVLIEKVEKIQKIQKIEKVEKVEKVEKAEKPERPTEFKTQNIRIENIRRNEKTEFVEQKPQIVLSSSSKIAEMFSRSIEKKEKPVPKKRAPSNGNKRPSFQIRKFEESQKKKKISNIINLENIQL